MNHRLDVLSEVGGKSLAHDEAPQKLGIWSLVLFLGECLGRGAGGLRASLGGMPDRQGPEQGGLTGLARGGKNRFRTAAIRPRLPCPPLRLPGLLDLWDCTGYGLWHLLVVGRLKHVYEQDELTVQPRLPRPPLHLPGPSAPWDGADYELLHFLVMGLLKYDYLQGEMTSSWTPRLA